MRHSRSHRSQNRSPSETARRRSFVLAEYLAIDALYTGHNGLFQRTFVHTALTFLLIGVLGFGLAESLKPVKERLFRRRSRSFGP